MRQTASGAAGDATLPCAPQATAAPAGERHRVTSSPTATGHADRRLSVTFSSGPDHLRHPAVSPLADADHRHKADALDEKLTFVARVAQGQ